MNKPLSQDDIAAMEGQLRSCVEEDRKYWRVNNVKCDAIHTARTYEEFAYGQLINGQHILQYDFKSYDADNKNDPKSKVDRVAAAHLRPLEKADHKNKGPRAWNQFAAKETDKE